MGQAKTVVMWKVDECGSQRGVQILPLPLNFPETPNPNLLSGNKNLNF